MIQSKVRVGMGGAKPVNAVKEAEKQEAKDRAKGKALKVPEGGKLYKTVGEPVLNIKAPCGNIKFIGGYYATADKEELEVLAYFADPKRGTIEEVTNG